MEQYQINKIPIDWEKHHAFMPFNGFCGPAVIKIIFSATGIRKSIWEISLWTWKWWYGCANQLLIAYLSKFYSLVNFKLNGKISDIASHLKAGHIVIVNFWDNGVGHYAIISEYKKHLLTFVDPSRERNWKYVMTTSTFKEIWYDTLNVDDSLYHEGLLIWIDPKSKR